VRGSTCSSASFSLNRRLQPSEVVRILTFNPLLLTYAPFAVHILSGDLILHKRTLGPVKSLIYSLWHYDVDRTAACLDVPASESEKVVGYMSNKAMIYLVGPFLHGLRWLHLLSLQADVHDHIEYALASMDMYSAMAENLVNYSFNVCHGPCLSVVGAKDSCM